MSLPEDAELHPVGTVSSIIQQLGKNAATHINSDLFLKQSVEKKSVEAL